MTNLFFNHYTDPKRQHEIDLALKKNREVFDKVIIVEGRPTFSQLFELTKDYPNDINCFCNSDIYFTDLSFVKYIKPNECFAVTRQDLVGTIYQKGSQDAWIFYGVVKKMPVNFTQGLWGADNRLAFEIFKAGYYLTNPCHYVPLVHLHSVDNRQQKRTKENTVSPPYHFIK